MPAQISHNRVISNQMFLLSFVLDIDFPFSFGTCAF